MKRRLAGKFLVFLLSLGMVFSTAFPLGGTAWADATDSVWTALDDIDAAAESEQPVAITMEDVSQNYAGIYALTATTSSAGPIAEKASLNNERELVIGGVKEEFGWTVTKTENEGAVTYTFQNSDGKYLYVTANNNGVRVGDKPTPIGGDWSLTGVSASEGATLDYLNAEASDGVRFLGVYQATNWRCYKLGSNGSFPSNIKDQTLKFWKYDRDEAGQEMTVTDISTVLEASTGEFMVKGAVTLIDGNNLYVQDATGGICVRCAAVPSGVAVGDTIIGTGVRGVYNGLPQLNNSDYSKVTDPAETISLEPAETTIGALTTADICKYVTIKDLIVEKVSGTNVDVKDANGGSIQIYKAVLGDPAPVAGDVITFTGAVGIYQNASQTTLQLRNTAASEIVVTSSVTPPDPGEGDTFGLASTIADGDEVILYNAGSGKGVGNTIASNKVSGVTLAPTDGVITTDDTSVVWKVNDNGDGTYTFTQGDYTLGGKVVTSGDKTYNNLLLSGADYTGFTLEGPDSTDFNYYLKFADWTSNNGTFYLEYYNGFTVYASKDPGRDAFGITFYKKGAEPETPDPGDMESFGLASTIADGDEVILYNAGSGKGIGNTITSNKVSGVSLTPKDGVITTNDRNVVWKVNDNGDGTYTFTQGDYTLGGKVVTEGDKTYNNLLLSGADYTRFILSGPDEMDFNYYLKFAGWSSTNGQFYLEYYNGFTVYASKDPGRDAFGITFYKKGAEPETPHGSDPGEIGDLITSLEELTDGQYVAIYSPSRKTAVSSLANGDWYLKAKAAKITSEGKLLPFTSDYVWKVKVNADGTYSFYSSDNEADSITVWPSGKYAELTVNTNYPEGVNTWNVAPAGSVQNAFTVSSATLTGVNGDNSGPAYIKANSSENFAGSFITNPSGADYALQFYKIDPANAVDDFDDGDWDGVLTKGKQYVIYNDQTVNDSTQLALGLYKAANYAMDAIPSDLTGSNPVKAVPGNGAYVFTVDSMGRYYTFKNNGKYLATNNDEELFFEEPLEDGSAPNNAKWYLESNKDGYIIYNKVANYRGSPVCIEYFSSVFSGWTFKSTNPIDIYLFNFYELAEDTIVHDDIVQVPTAVFDCENYRYVEQNFPVTITLDDLCPEILPEKTKITYAVNGKNDVIKTGEITEYSASSDYKNYTFTIPAEELDVTDPATGELCGHFDLTIEVTNGYGINYTCSKPNGIGINDQPFFDDLKPEPNSQTGDDLTPVISARLWNAGTDPTITMTINDENAEGVTYEDGVISYTPAEDLTPGNTTVALHVMRKDGVAANKTWSFIAGKSEYQPYFGQLHSHTTYSDGSGSLDTALDYIASLPESANVQFVAFTDHSNYFDTASAANPADAVNDKELMTPASKAVWEGYKEKVANFNAKQNDIVAIGGFEMTWSGGPGHINTFDSDGLVSRNNAQLNNKSNDAGMKLYYETINKGDSMNQFNHPGNTFGNFTDFSYWDEATDDHMFLVEVGNGEGQIGAGGYYPSYEQYTMALDKGWHVAPTNNQDNHKGRWGNANDARDVVLTDDFSEEGIYKAIRERRVYATEDKNLQISYTVNGKPMGTIFEESPETLNIEITNYDPDNVDLTQKVDLIANGGRVVKTWNEKADLEKGRFEAELSPEYSYYYVRITQGDGDKAVTAPVWVGSNISAGIRDVAAPESALVNNDATLTTTFFNNEDEAATVKNIVYTKDGDVIIGTDTTGHTIPAGGSIDVPFTFVPDKAKRTTVTVTAVMDVRGIEQTYTKDVTFSVKASEGPLEVTPIAEVQAQTEEGYEYAIEGVVTSNASGFDKDTAFFDCIYVQDDTAGICCFPVSGEYKIGDIVHIEGYTDFYQGEAELQVASIEVIGEGGSIIPTEVTAAQINDQSMLGSLVSLRGTVESFEVENGLIQTIMIKDAKGDVARVFIDGYITTDKEVEGCKVGDEILAIGLASYDDTFNAPDGPFPRIRIRNRADILCGDVVPSDPADVEAAINELPKEITAEDEEAITKARELYNKLSAEDKEALPAELLPKLEAAEAKLTSVKSESKTEAIRALAADVLDASKVNTGNYKDSTSKPFKAAISAAEKVLKDPNATTEQLKAANETLKAASNGLVLKLNNPMTVKGKTAKLKASKLKKKSRTVKLSKALTIKNSKGKLTYAKVSGNKKITINKATGKIKVKKGLKKGTYKVKVKVTAAGNADYKAGAQTKVFKIKVK
ncbi:MAG: CehA/McbA family metallohydrolase [Mogibacterium sp.]|nr:CehA/McbA family metallohydrolase [Mogibacterium sp.]